MPLKSLAVQVGLVAKTGRGARSGSNARARAITPVIAFDLILVVICLQCASGQRDIYSFSCLLLILGTRFKEFCKLPCVSKGADGGETISRPLSFSGTKIKHDIEVDSYAGGVVLLTVPNNALANSIQTFSLTLVGGLMNIASQHYSQSGGKLIGFSSTIPDASSITTSSARIHYSLDAKVSGYFRFRPSNDNC